MPGYRLLYKKPAAKEIRKLPEPVRKRLKVKLEWSAAQKDPLQFASALTKPADAQFRFRVGAYRVLFDLDGTDIVILHVQHRREIYRK